MVSWVKLLDYRKYFILEKNGQNRKRIRSLSKSNKIKGVRRGRAGKRAVSPAGGLEPSIATGVQREGQTGSASLTRSLAGLEPKSTSENGSRC